MKLKISEVIYDAVAHTYTLDGNELKGITALIKEKLFPNEYRDVPEVVLQKAAERGHRIHSVIELFDTCDIPTTECEELKGYQQEFEQHPFMRNHLESEYVVSDNSKYASAIDKVYDDGQGGVVLADIKTTYKLDTDYVSWQLSVYAYFFSLLNPDIPVTSAYAIWLRRDKHKVVEVKLHTTDEVKALLYGDEVPQKDSGFNEMPYTESYLLHLKALADDAATKYEEAKQQMLTAMQDSGLKTIKGQLLSITRKDDCKRISFDSKKFKADNPDMYNNYLKESVTKGGIIIKEI